ncbi:hypothetical protein GCM10009712_24390 [Pseudarthrobacter sulfonivorans]
MGKFNHLLKGLTDLIIRSKFKRTDFRGGAMLSQYIAPQDEYSGPLGELDGLGLGQAAPGIDLEGVRAAIADLVTALGMDLSDPGLAETPRRVAQAFAEMFTARSASWTTFPNTEWFNPARSKRSSRPGASMNSASRSVLARRRTRMRIPASSQENPHLQRMHLHTCSAAGTCFSSAT